MGLVEKLLLHEISKGKKKFLFKKIKQRLTSIGHTTDQDIDDSFNQRLVNNIIDNYISVTDPTWDGKALYSAWIVDIFTSEPYTTSSKINYSLMEEDSEKIKDLLDTFEKAKVQIKRDDKSIDINDYDSIQDLYELVKNYAHMRPDPESVEDEQELLDNQFYIERDQAVIVSNNSNYMCVHVKSLEASKFYGCTSSWCTRYPRNFDSYNERGVLLIFINKNELNSNGNDRRHQLFLEYDIEDGAREFEWRALNDAEYFSFKDMEQITEFFEENDNMDEDIYSYLDKNKPEFIFYSGSNDKQETKKGWFYNEEGFLSFRGELSELAPYVMPSTDISKDFIADVLSGEAWDHFIYDSDFVEYDYVIRDIDSENERKLEEKIKEIKGEDFEYDDLYDLIKQDDELEEVKRAIIHAFAQAQEIADQDEYYSLIVEHLKDNLKVYDFKYTGDGALLYTDFNGVPKNENIKQIFGSVWIYELLDEIKEEMETFHPPRMVYGTVSEDLANEGISNNLYDI